MVRAIELGQSDSGGGIVDKGGMEGKGENIIYRFASFKWQHTGSSKGNMMVTRIETII